MYAIPTRNRHIYEIINIFTITSQVTIAEYSTFFEGEGVIKYDPIFMTSSIFEYIYGVFDSKN